MNNSPLKVLSRPYAFLFSLLFMVSCEAQNQPSQAVSAPKEPSSTAKTIFLASANLYGPVPDPFLEGQISQYVRRIFQDKNGVLWFGTNSDGVCRYDGKTLTYYTTTEGFSGNAVRGMVADANGNIWFATDGGICRYDINRANHACNNNTCKHDPEVERDIQEHSKELAKSFTRYSKMDGLNHDQVWSILMDTNGNLWLGTEGGVSFFNVPLQLFTNFPLPVMEDKDYPGAAYPAPKLVNTILQDNKGNIWFGTNGMGAFRYDGAALTNLSEKDGLCNNFVQCMLEDKAGTLWFGSRFGGLSRYDPASGKFVNYTTKEGLSTDFIWGLLEDKNVPDGAVGIWISAVAGGLGRYDSEKGGVSFFISTEGLTSKHVQSIFRDKDGVLWLGCSGGLFRWKEAQKSFVNVKRIGPWE